MKPQSAAREWVNARSCFLAGGKRSDFFAVLVLSARLCRADS